MPSPERVAAEGGGGAEIGSAPVPAHQRGLPARVRTLPKAPDVGREFRRWWKRRNLEAVLDDGGVTLAQAMADVGVMSMAYLLRRLGSEKTPARVRDQIALTMAPKLVAEARGRLPKDGNARPRGNELVEVLEAYRVKSG